MCLQGAGNILVIKTDKVPTVRKPAVQASTVLMALYSLHVSELFLSS